MFTRKASVRTLKPLITGLYSTSTDGAFDEWMHRFGEGLHIGEHLGLEAGTYRLHHRPTNKLLNTWNDSRHKGQPTNLAYPHATSGRAKLRQ
jgi:hypothetical protein